MVVHACNPSTWEAETGGSQVRDQPRQLSEALSNLARPCINIKNKIWLGLLLGGRMLLGSIPSIPPHPQKIKLVVVGHTCNPSTWEAETGGSQVQGQLQQFDEALSNLVRPYFKI